MSEVIWKYPLDLSHRQTVAMPQNAIILKVGAQDDQLCLWCRVTPGLETENRQIRIEGTGHKFTDEPGTYLDTVIMGPFVWHVFEEYDPKG